MRRGLSILLLYLVIHLVAPECFHANSSLLCFFPFNADKLVPDCNSNSLGKF